MAFQKQVQRYPAKGVTGMQAGSNPLAFTCRSRLPGDGVIIGRAAWPGHGGGHGGQHGQRRAAGHCDPGKGGGDSLRGRATMTYIAGQAVPIAVRGDLLLTSAQAVTAGQNCLP